MRIRFHERAQLRRRRQRRFPLLSRAFTRHGISSAELETQLDKLSNLKLGSHLHEAEFRRADKETLACINERAIREIGPHMAQNTRRPRARLDSGYEHLDGQGAASRTTIPTCKLGAVSFGKGTPGASRRLVALLIAPQPPRPDSAPIGKRRIVCDNDIHGSRLPHLAEMYGYGVIFRLREWREKHEVPKPLVADAAPTMQTVCLNESAPYPFIFATFFSCNQKCIRSIRKKEKKGGGSSTGNMPQGYAFQGACSQLVLAPLRPRGDSRARSNERSRGCARSWESVLGGCSLGCATRKLYGGRCRCRRASRRKLAQGERRRRMQARRAGDAGAKQEGKRGGAPKGAPPPRRWASP